VAAAVFAALPVAAASAGTVRVDHANVVYDGHANSPVDLTVTRLSDSLVRFSEPDGTPLTVGEQCTNIAASIASCTFSTWYSASISLGDGDDRAHVALDSRYPTDVYGGAGNDVLDAVSNATLRGNDGADTFTGCCGDVRVSYDAEREPVTVRLPDAGVTTGNGRGGEDDTIGSGVTDVTGTPFSDVIEGNSADNEIDAVYGDDVVRGGAGADSIDAPWGRADVDAGSGDDTINGGPVIHELDGGPGHDTATITSNLGASLITLDGRADDGPLPLIANATWYPGVVEASDLEGWVAEKGNVHDVEELRLSEGRDVVIGSGGADEVHGDWGDDTLVGGAGQDTLDGGVGNDVIWARDGEADRVECGDDWWGSSRDEVIADSLDTIAADCDRVYYGSQMPPPPAPLGPPPAELPRVNPVGTDWDMPGEWWEANFGIPTPPPPPPVTFTPAPAPPARPPRLIRRPIIIEASKTQVRPGTRITIRGIARPNEQVVLDADRRQRGIFKTIRRAKADATGRYVFRRVRLRVSTNYLVRLGVQSSPVVKVKVMPKRRSRR
jgi:Ca2+-binding RTX toxin-like protein